MPDKLPLSHKPKPAHIKKAEWKRLQLLHIFEEAARQQGFTSIAGVDEAGRGPLAGPVVAAACLIPEDVFIIGVNDSKQLSPKQRCMLYETIISDSRISFGVGIVSNSDIDEINILQATIRAMLLAIEKLVKRPDYLLIDGLKIPHPLIPCQKIVNGDELSHSIAAASIIAKETRDRLMQLEHMKWPQYGFDKNKGYGTAEHLKALEAHGVCPIHRLSFSPCCMNHHRATESTEGI